MVKIKSKFIFYLMPVSCLYIYIELLQSHTEEDFIGRVVIYRGPQVQLVSDLQVEQEAPTSSVDISASVQCSVGVEVALRDLDSVFVDKYVDVFPKVRVGHQREVDPPGSTEAGDELASVDINPRRISLQAKLVGVEQFLVRDHGVS